jgi:hypothetical protein
MFDVLAMLSAAVVGFPAPAEEKGFPTKPGVTVPDFSLQDVHRRPRSLARFLRNRRCVTHHYFGFSRSLNQFGVTN